MLSKDRSADNLVRGLWSSCLGRDVIQLPRRTILREHVRNTMRTPLSTIGMDKDTAVEMLTAAGWTCFVRREDAKEFEMKCDYRATRVNIEIDDGKVTRYFVG